MPENRFLGDGRDDLSDPTLWSLQRPPQDHDDILLPWDMRLQDLHLPPVLLQSIRFEHWSKAGNART